MKLRIWLILLVSNLVAAHHKHIDNKCSPPSRCQSVNECTELLQRVLGWITTNKKSFSSVRNIVKRRHPSCKRGWGVCCPYESFFERQIGQIRIEVTTTKIIETTPKIVDTSTPEIPATTPKVRTPSVTIVSPDNLKSKYHAYQVLKKHPSFRLLTGSHCGFGNFQHRIGHGRNADPGEIPWIVMLRYLEKGKGAFRCGGSLISVRYVLTAAHCIIHDRKKDFKLTSVWLGETNLVNTLDCMDTGDDSTMCALPQEIMIEEAIPHPDFSYKYRLRGLPNDIGLIRLAEEAELSSFVRPICLAGLANLDVQRFMNIDYNDLTVAGWGMVSMKADPLSNELQVVNVTMVDREKCHKLYRREPHKCHICAGGTTGNACMGDSGGPLMVQARKNRKMSPLVVGVTSFGSEHCGYHFPTVFTDVTCYLPWILDNVKK